MPITNYEHIVIQESAEFLTVTKEYVRLQIEEMKASLHKIWNSMSPNDIESVTRFYTSNPLHFYNVIEFNTWSDAQRPPILEGVTKGGKIRLKSALDFGCGCGTTAIFLSELGESGIQVDIADVNTQLQNFAKWRLDRRGYKSEIVSLLGFKPIKKHYDLITCLDVLEHLTNPLEMISHFREHADYVYLTALKPAKISQHLNLWDSERIIDIICAIGFEAMWLAPDQGRGLFKVIK
jgi:2-polyprenyl-3-methyl-5-hydroxy-6-metoxy-1,4-benzoquinol methylase